MRKITLMIDDTKMQNPHLVFDERMGPFLLRHLTGTITEPDVAYYRECGVAVAVDGFSPFAEASPEEQAMQPLWEAVNTIREWRDTELLDLKKRWFALAEEAAMTAIHRVEQGRRADVLGQWPMDEFLHAVWTLVSAMYERGHSTDPWYAQDFTRVAMMLAVRGLGLNTDQC
jgi:hypothetical protein